MYQAVEKRPKMTRNQAMEHYPNHYILMQKDSDGDMSDPMGTILYIGDDGDELFTVQVKQPVMGGVVYEGINIQKYSIGGIVVAQRSI